MIVKDLRRLLFECDDNLEVVIGCQGYLTEYNADDEIRVKQSGNAVYITDNCYYKEVDCEA